MSFNRTLIVGISFFKHRELSSSALLVERSKGRLRGHAYDCIFILYKKAILGPILLMMWVGAFKNVEKYAYIRKVCSLRTTEK